MIDLAVTDHVTHSEESRLADAVHGEMKYGAKHSDAALTDERRGKPLVHQVPLFDD